MHWDWRRQLNDSPTPTLTTQLDKREFRSFHGTMRELEEYGKVSRGSGREELVYL
jgi:hypothetical protein